MTTNVGILVYRISARVFEQAYSNYEVASRIKTQVSFEKTQWTWSFRVFSRKTHKKKTHLELGLFGFFREKVGFYRGNLGIF